MSGELDPRAKDSIPAAPLRPLTMMRRRWVSVLVAFVLTLVAATVTAFVLPATYISTGTILIEQQEVPVELVRSTISSFADQRIQVITQRVMTTDNLLRIIQQYDLYSKDRRRKGREKIIEQMREDVMFSNIKADVIDPRQGRPVQATIAFSLGYKSRSPELSARVANEISSLYLQENLESRRQLTTQAATFLQDEGEKLSVLIKELEARVASFKEQNVNRLPELGQLNMQLMERADDEKRDVDTQLRALDQQVVFLEAQLAQIGRTAQVYTSTGERVMSPADRLKVLRSQYAQASAIYAPDHPDVSRLRREIDGLEADGVRVDSTNDHVRLLNDARADLAEARQRYAPGHPDLVKQERLVAGLESAPRDSSASAAPVEQPDNPAYIQIDAQREAALAQRKSLQQKRTDLDTRIMTLAQRLEASPGVERDYAGMLRELDSTQIKYREVRQKQMEAQLAQNLEVERKGERFTLIEPPIAPDEPASPNRPLVLAFGLILALAVSLGLAVVLEITDRSVRDRDDLTALLAVPPLAIIPWIETDQDRRRRLRRHRIALVSVVASVAGTIALTHLLYRPLDVLWAIAMRRMGI